MKKLLLAGLGVVLTGLVVVGMLTLSNVKDTDVVKEHGFMVLKDNTKDETTIVAEITSEDKDNDGYIIATNVYDKNDTVAIEKGFKKGEVVLITFNQDEVVNVELNKLNVGNKVKGQEIAVK